MQCLDGIKSYARVPVLLIIHMRSESSDPWMEQMVEVEGNQLFDIKILISDPLKK